ncbi:DUF4349 domain-containing protein [Halocatena halophila]|uniref:DUF4349 domain-containing protein n=1 Tax=Halocatena halophila TaxID=2814576 RepID=UPI002ED496B6
MEIRTKSVVILALLVMLAGCGGVATQDSAQSGGGEPPAGAADSRENAKAEQSAESEAVSVESAIVRAGDVHTRVSNTTQSRDRITSIVRTHGGTVSASSESFAGRDGQQHRSEIVYRVPAENFTTVFEETKAVGSITHARSNSTDVSDQLTDLNARLKNLRSQRDRLRGLYSNASDTEAVLSVSEKLSEVQSEIERLEAKQAALKDRVAYSTLTVELTERPSTTSPDQTAWYETGIVAAFLESVDGVVTVFRAIVVGLAYLAPYLLVFGVPLTLAGYAVHKRRTE